MPPVENNSGEEAQWSYKTDEQPSTPARSITWTASEFIDHQRGTGWYMTFLAALGLAGALTYLFTKDYVSAGAIVLAGLVVVLISRKRPRQLPYELNDKGLKVGERLYRYDGFKSFGMSQDGGVKVINFVPLRRFMPDISVFFPADQEQNILNVISDHLPHDEHGEKTIDKLAKKLRF